MAKKERPVVPPRSVVRTAVTQGIDLSSKLIDIALARAIEHKMTKNAAHWKA